LSLVVAVVEAPTLMMEMVQVVLERAGFEREQDCL
jgi:hypothetical protein